MSTDAPPSTQPATSGEDTKHVYKGNCHCGAFRYELTLDAPISDLMACNCSYCTKKGYLWVFPSPGQVNRTHGQWSDLSVYQFGEKSLFHRFCPTCGTAIGASKEGGKDGAINARSLNLPAGTDWSALKGSKVWDGKHENGSYEEPEAIEAPSVEGEEEGLKTYTGGCHCGAVKVAFKAKPLEETGVVVDDCSICQRVSPPHHRL
jgi:hypothetical protein